MHCPLIPSTLGLFCHFSHICTRVMALDLHQNFVSAQYLENILTEFHQIDICIYIDKIYIGIVTHYFSHFCTRVMAFYLCQNLVSAQYLLRTNQQNFTKLYICICLYIYMWGYTIYIYIFENNPAEGDS